MQIPLIDLTDALQPGAPRSAELGDMVPRWTNGLYHSNPHRVRNLHSGGLPRHSIPFFYSPDYLARVEPVPTCVSTDNPARFAPCTAGEHLQQMAAQTYGLKA